MIYENKHVNSISKVFHTELLPLQKGAGALKSKKYLMLFDEWDFEHDSYSCFTTCEKFYYHTTRHFNKSDFKSKILVMDAETENV